MVICLSTDKYVWSLGKGAGFQCTGLVGGGKNVVCVIEGAHFECDQFSKFHRPPL